MQQHLTAGFLLVCENLFLYYQMNNWRVCSDILTYGMKKCGTLPRADMTNIFSCLDVYDIDFDGSKEILIGNSTEVHTSHTLCWNFKFTYFFQDIFLYKFRKDKGWCLTDLKKIGVPILGLLNMDVNGDGIRELIVMTMKGVHVFQHNLKVAEILEKKAEKYVNDTTEK